MSLDGDEGQPLLLGYSFGFSYGASDDRLGDFYLPALERCIRCDRTTGFFSSVALALAATGLVRLIQNGGRMRLLCGAQLDKKDVEAIRKGAELKGVVGDAMAGCLSEPGDRSVRARLEALAWMVASGKLEIRVVLPRGKDGLPLPGDQAREYYHPKEGLFVDEAGNKLAFSGSINDSESGWQLNYETFHVFATWDRQFGDDLVVANRMNLREIERRFDRLWEIPCKEESWIALEIPEAAKKKLLKYAPPFAPKTDPLEAPPKAPEKKQPPPAKLPDPSLDERVEFRFLREAPFLPNADRIGIETSTVRPWPHQTRVVAETLARFPENFLFCDEVGLGKTIEAGLVLRQLLVSGRVRRVLLLVPRSVVSQWQEELYEKFALNVPRLTDNTVLDVFDRPIPWSGASVWDGCSLLLASSQLAKRRDRQDEVLTAAPWDLVIVDEAHHARRKEFLSDRYRPNRLMELLNGTGGRPGLKDRTRCLYLLTATPMQVHPVEVWDLLRIVGLGGRWGASEDNFLGYFEELRKPLSIRNWDFLLGMVRDFLDAGGRLDPSFVAAAERKLGFVDWEVIKDLPYSQKRSSLVASLGDDARAVLGELVRHHTPLRRFLWRNTRSLLRKYKAKGLLKENVPEREPKPVWIKLKTGPGNEQDLYDRIDEYISDFYQKYEAERKGLGFVMTVYRRRLTSSFFAIRESLQRRRDFLRGVSTTAGWLTDDDIEQDELDLDVSETLAQDGREEFLGELAYIDDFLSDLKSIGIDSKLGILQVELREIFEQRDTVIIFTQYTDTMDYLRDELRHVYGGQVACYSGRGGEQWDGAAWVPVEKEKLKEAFRQGDSVKILLCTESASEGLNLQTCGVLINYDMPWNPMRVEQRIGRIDRIGQKYSKVWIRNYFYEGTVEATIYQRLSDRIDWFETVVGELQPILHRVGSVIQAAAMMKGAVRRRHLDEAISGLRKEIDDRETQSLSIDDFGEDEVIAPTSDPPPVTLQQMERAIVRSVSLGPLFSPHAEISGAHRLRWHGQNHAVTFDPAIFDKHPYTVQFLTYGNPLLDELLASAPDPPAPDKPGGAALFRTTSGSPISLFVAATDNGGAQVVSNLPALKQAASGGPAWTDHGESEAATLFAVARRKRRLKTAEVTDARRKAERLAIVEDARLTLVHSGLLEIALSQQPELFESTVPQGFGTEVVQGLGRRGAPFKALLRIVKDPDLAADATDPFFLENEGQGRTVLQRRFEALRQKGFDLVQRYAALAPAPTDLPVQDDTSFERLWLSVPVPTAAQAAAPSSGGATVLPFRLLAAPEAKPFVNCILLYRDMKLAAGAFTGGQVVAELPIGRSGEQDAGEWAEPFEKVPIGQGMFIARVTGESMNRRIPNGAWCVWRVSGGLTPQNTIVLAEHRSIFDDETQGHFTVKLFTSEELHGTDGAWVLTRVVLRPSSLDPNFKPITLEGEEAHEVRVLATLVKVLQ